MSFSSRAIALQGVGFGAAVVALQGFSPVAPPDFDVVVPGGFVSFGGQRSLFPFLTPCRILGDEVAEADGSGDLYCEALEIGDHAPQEATIGACADCVGEGYGLLHPYAVSGFAGADLATVGAGGSLEARAIFSASYDISAEGDVAARVGVIDRLSEVVAKQQEQVKRLLALGLL